MVLKGLKPVGSLERLLTFLFNQEDIGIGETLYMRRWRIAGYHAPLPSLFGRNLMLHKMVRPDGDPDPHDHPWCFWSLVLWGGYIEHVYTMVTKAVPRQVKHFPHHVRRRVLSLAFRPGDHMHRVDKLPKGVAWTLVLTSGRYRPWGFWTNTGWVHFQKYTSHKQ